MSTANLEVLVEEPSAEAALSALLPKIVPVTPWQLRVFPGKQGLLRRLPARLHGYSAWAPATGTRLVILLDRDRDDCLELKTEVSKMVVDAGLRVASATEPAGTVLPRIVVKELEAWFLGDVPALRSAFPRLPAGLAQRAKYRDPDGITDTSRVLESLLQQHNYHVSGLQKLALAHEVAPHMDVDNNSSRSFQVFRDGLRRLASEGTDVQAH
ncbi:DUF4276 family protein [Saccharopolyspora gloriosae]|uniref:DUF4276 family protein n=1 Tax=Saccharopolyspora gloriosae TaxID=455344 RepID=A0A840NGP1_9PSEU|nr:DUF4276 family protein [Saccharopolyspora gloriosae]MBB5068469.1 hypothetical protein [Saccharopolyspora gloriosae]